MQSDEQEIRQLVATWMAATKAGDIETVLSLMAEDVVFLLPGQPPMIGKSAFAAAAQAQSSPGPVAVRRHERDSRDQGAGRMGVYVGKAIGRGYSARRCSVNDACRAYAFHPQKAKRQMGPGARREHAFPVSKSNP